MYLHTMCTGTINVLTSYGSVLYIENYKGYSKKMYDVLLENKYTYSCQCDLVYHSVLCILYARTYMDKSEPS